MKLTLFVLSGEKEGQKVSFRARQVITFGRTTDSDYSFEDDGHMSALHFEVEHKGNYAEIRDRGSRNRTWLNGDEVRVAELQDGDRIKAGHTLLRVSLEQPAPIPVPPSRSGSNFDRRDFDKPIPEGSISPTIDIPSVSGQPEGSDPNATDSERGTDVSPQPAKHRPFPSTMPFRPETPKTETSNRVSPIESVYFPTDQSLASKNSNVGNQKFHSGPNAANNPFVTDSFQASDSATTQLIENAKQAATSVDVLASEVQFLHKVQNPEGVEATLQTVVALLQSRMSMVAVAHFQKIRMTTPSELTNAQPLLDWLPKDISRDRGPVLLNWEDWERVAKRQLLGRLCRADGLIVFFGTSQQALTSQIKEMMRTEIAGFSEADGFLGCCWPSTFTALRYCSENAVYSKLFGKSVVGAILSPPQRPLELAAIAKPTLATSLSEFGFVGV